MPAGRRGLVVPQNTFLENIVRRSNGLHPNFILGNAQILGNPIVYASDGFCKLTGFSRSEVMKKSSDCTFLHGEHTSNESMKEIHDALINKQALQLEIIIYKKDGLAMWVLLHIGPIVNEKGEVVLFLMTIKDITEYKDPIPGTDQGGAKGWARLNKSLTRHKTVLVAFKQKSASQKNAQQITHLMSLNDDIIPQYKQEIPETPPRVILHYNTFKTSWDWVILILTLYTTVSVPFMVCFAYNSEPLNILDMIVDWLFIADIVLNFHTTYVGKDGEIIDDPRLIRLNYLKTWFVLDLVSSLPYGVLYFIPKSEMEQTEIANLLSFLRVFRLLRLGRVARKIDKYLEYGASTFFLLMLSFCLVAHWMACMFYVIATKYDKYDVHCWLYILADQIGMQYKKNGNSTEYDYTNTGPTIAARYVSALYYTLTSLTTIGFGNISPNTTAEKLFGCVTMLLGSILFSLIFGQVSAILQQSQKNTAKYHSIIDNMRQFSKLYKLPSVLADRIIDYFMSTWASNKGIDTDEVLKYCPKDLQADICVHLNRVVLENNLAFRDAPMGVKRAIARNFWICHVAPNDRIIHHGESLDVLYFIARGSLEVKQGEAVVGLLGEGDVFGDNVCNEPTVGQSAVDVHALTYCDLHCIQRDALLEVLEFYPEFAMKFAKNLQLSYNLRDELTIRRRTPSIVVHDEEGGDDLRPVSVTYRGKRNRKLSLVEELAYTYDIPDSTVDHAHNSVEEAALPAERMVLPERTRTPNTLRAKPELFQDSVDVISSLTEMKGEVRREIEVMNMKMTQLEQQVSLILNLLKSQGHLHSRASGNLHESSGNIMDSPQHDEFNDSMNSPVGSRRDTRTQPPQSPRPREDPPKDDPLPDWLAPPGSASSQHSIPDWENQEADQSSASAARLLNKDEQKPSEQPDPRALQILKLMQKK
ncbi:potassium voltage-gated channel subfamily H member 1 isoform X2 [Nematostella vectensis]|uniref:EAG n=2 Tax=Nematostella vectensis TaxID=45351 RepID=A0A089N7J2_NEMVE|nr:potassium voltage-gated channel subfamily H member 1 isoform X2 [Nematostella vectensis]XP_032232879.1 potassium voltage-gated channel subfamily H member 1 isoform X2 [Nematostella vectensis]XP_032232880.1 potassium voltage-gated channel subfamily H member 1 isoform X2 [Nematostella vectensis]XP_032232882.1 potassium voltage-gated channel subfamily H member 1 isoform X2 [Nematostella vectensis]XP_032232883.1 potassium voltage-gated channel subfamily H member 1 isoform X2 [Nematostella vecten